MELPIWILAISQILVDIFIIVLIVLMIAVVFALRAFIKMLHNKSEPLLTEANDAVAYVKESRIADILARVFAPKKGFKYWKKHRNDVIKES